VCFVCPVCLRFISFPAVQCRAQPVSSNPETNTANGKLVPATEFRLEHFIARVIRRLMAATREARGARTGHRVTRDNRRSEMWEAGGGRQPRSGARIVDVLARSLVQFANRHTES